VNPNWFKVKEMAFCMDYTKLRVPALLLLFALCACSKQPEANAPAAAPTTAPAAGTASASPAAAAAANIAGMNAEQLRNAAGKALAENRIYAPGGNNALEFYLAARDKQPNDANVTSALSDLLPYTIIAAEQNIAHEDFSEAQRLITLIERTDSHAPALPRLKQSIASGQVAAGKRIAEEAAKAQQVRQQEQQRQAQQAEQQRKAAEAPAAQQLEATKAKAVVPPPAEPVAQPAPVRPAPPPPQAAAAPATPVLQAISMPQPHYPAEAYRAGTSGEVVVELTVGTDGSVTNARVVRATPIRVFDRDALNAIRRWKFAPISEPVTTRRTITFSP
jgi:protein TonB